jgi:hypothetical protein
MKSLIKSLHSVPAVSPSRKDTGTVRRTGAPGPNGVYCRELPASSFQPSGFAGGWRLVTGGF